MIKKTSTDIFKARFGRRDFLGTISAGVGIAALGSVPQVAFADSKTVKLGMNIPMTGDYAAWGGLTWIIWLPDYCKYYQCKWWY